MSSPEKYNHIWVNDLLDRYRNDNNHGKNSRSLRVLFPPLKEIKKHAVRSRGKHKLVYLEVFSGFDIETTTTEDHNGYMYIWQMCINNTVVLGSEWSEFIDLLNIIAKYLKLSKEYRLIIWVANLSFEFQFMRKWFLIESIFAKEKRQPLQVLCTNGIEFREALSISGMGGLAQLAKEYCTTQKLVGDLDYNIARNKTDGRNLKPAELQYCLNDVIILREFSEYIFNEFIIKQKYVPLTSTQIIRRKVQDLAPKDIHRAIVPCFFPTEDEYHLYMMYLFRGGFVHANYRYANKILKNVLHIDIKSSYPDEMYNSYVPVSPFMSSKMDISEAIKKYCCIIDVTFYNLNPTTDHSIESLNKVLDITGKIIDNGRVRHANFMRVLLTELDFKVYQLYYKWDSMEVHSLKIARRGKMPRYIMAALTPYYEIKESYSRKGLKDTIEYKKSKPFVNGFYGMTVSRMHPTEIKYDEEMGWTDELNESFSYEKEKDKAFLLPQFGIWITAAARHKLLTVQHRCKNVYYGDTDSLFMENCEHNRRVLEEINREQMKRNKQAIKHYGLSKYFLTIGTWDIEAENIDRFKTLGAKRYIEEIDGKLSVTIAGLPKNALVDYCQENNLDLFEIFRNKMFLDVIVSKKLAHTYNDKPHAEVVNGELMVERSSVGIYKTTFQLTLAEEYLNLMRKIKEVEQHGEARIY